MIIRAAIAAPLGLGVFSSLMLIPGNMGFAASGLCYVLMMVALGATVPSFLRRGGGGDARTSDGGSLFTSVLGKVKGVPASVIALPTTIKSLPSWFKAHLPFMRKPEPEEPPQEVVPDAIAVLNELKEEFAAEESAADGGSPVDEEVEAIDDLSEAPEEAESPAEEPITGRFAFFQRVLRRMAKLPGIAYLLSLTVRLEVKRNQPEDEAETDVDADEPLLDGAIESL